MKKLTVEQINNELRKLMDEQPDFRYTKGGTCCFYFRGTLSNPECDGCIFGQAFQRLGITKDTLKNECSRNSIDELDEPWLTKERPQYWQTIQEAQDDGQPWGSLKHYLPDENDNPHQSTQDSQQPQVG